MCIDGFTLSDQDRWCYTEPIVVYQKELTPTASQLKSIKRGSVPREIKKDFVKWKVAAQLTSKKDIKILLYIKDTEILAKMIIVDTKLIKENHEWYDTEDMKVEKFSG